MKDQQSYISVSAVYFTYPVYFTYLYGRFEKKRATTGEKNLIERIKFPIFLEAVLAIEAKVRAPIPM